MTQQKLKCIQSLNRNNLLTAVFNNVIQKEKMNRIKHRIDNPCLEENEVIKHFGNDEMLCN